MKYEVLIFKDQHHSRLRELVEQYFNRHSIKYCVEEVDDEEHIEEILGKFAPDFVFLHHLPASLEIAKKIKRQSEDAIIILIGNLSSHLDRQEEEFYDSVLYRPFNEERINDIMNTSFEKIKKSLKLFMFKHEDKMKIIPYRDILFFEKKFSGIKIYTRDQEYLLRENMNRLMSSLDSDDFVKCNSRQIINLKKISDLTAYKCKIAGFDGDISVGKRYLKRISSKIKP